MRCTFRKLRSNRPGAEEKDDRQRNLRDHQDLPDAPAPASRAGAAVRLQRFVRIGPRGVERREDADQQPGGDRERDAPEQHASGDAGLKIEHRQLRGDHRGRRLQADVREQESCGRSAECEEEALGQQVPGETHAPGAERKAHGELALPRRRAREKQVRQVGARDEKYEADRAEEHQRCGAHVLEQRRCPRRRRHPPAFVLLEPAAFRLVGRTRDGRQLRVHLLERDARSETRQRRELPDVPRHLRGIAAPRNPQIRADEHQPARHHADDRRRLAANPDCPLQDVRIAAEAALPEAVTDDRHPRASRPELLTREAPAERRRHAEDRQGIVEQEPGEHALGHIAPGDVPVAEVERRNVREGAAPADVRVFRRRHRLDVGRVRRELGKREPDGDETIRLGIRKRVQDETVHEPVDEAVAADADRQRQHRDGRESRAARELAQRVTDVLQQRVHFGLPSLVGLGSWFLVLGPSLFVLRVVLSFSFYRSFLGRSRAGRRQRQRWNDEL